MIKPQADALEKEIAQMRETILEKKRKLDSVLDLFRNASTYAVEESLGGTVQNYQYFVYPFKGVTLVDQSLYKIFAKYLAKMVSKDTEVLLTVEADGIGIATLLAAELGLPLIICKSFHYNIPCVEFVQETGYYKRSMHMPKIIQGKRVAIVDCLISTGGTIKNMIEKAIGLAGTTITGVYCVNNKSNYQENKDSKSAFAGYPYRYLFDTKINEKQEVESSMSDHLKRVFWRDIDVKFYQIAEKFLELSSSSKHGYRVGCVLVDMTTFEITAWGYRRGHVHAEQDALSMLRENFPDWQSRKYSIYSTMEPCSARNGSGFKPCAHLIGEIPQIKWVVIGEKDTMDGKINGNGIKYLLEKGKNVRVFKTDEVFLAENHASAPESPIPNLVPAFCAV
ncbi:hypothetical protein KKA13_01255 [Patescibacteria group bacterium]|nr:hypothetical protein [Patescibacteria group bacterium]